MQKKYKYIIIDDEPLAREIIRNFANNIEWLELVGQFPSANQAFPIINSNECDIVFIDINMPKINGLDFIKSLKSAPLFVFSTAFREYAVEAFELNAVDYLLKPFSFDRFLQACNKLYEKLESKSEQANEANLLNKANTKDFILVKSDTRFIKIEIDKIIYIEAYREYVKIHCTDQMVLSLISMKSIMELVPKDMFYRIHRSYIISIKYVEMIQGFDLIINKISLPISRELRDDFIEFLQNK